MRFGHFADRDSTVLPEEVENWFRKVSSSRDVWYGDETKFF